MVRLALGIFYTNMLIHHLFIIIWLSCCVVKVSLIAWEWTFYKDATSWNDGARFCNENGGRILKLTSNEKYDTLQQFKKDIFQQFWEKDIWLGLYHNTSGRILQWQGECLDIDTEIDEDKWDSDKPNNEKPCVMMDHQTLKWKPEVCKQEYIVICETKIDVSACTPHGNTAQFCANGQVDDSTILPKHYMDEESVKNPPCYTSEQSGTNADTTSSSSMESTSTSLSEIIYSITTTQPVRPETTSQRFASTDNLRITTSQKSTFGTVDPEATFQRITSTNHKSDTTYKNAMESITPETTSRRITFTDSIKETTYQTSSISDLLPPTVTNTTIFLLSETALTSTIELPEISRSTNTGYSTKKASSTTSDDLTNTTTTPNENLCMCTCSANITEEEFQQKLQEIRRILTIDKTKTIKAKFKKLSATDDRISCKTIGSFGLIVVLTLFLCIIALDLVSLPTYAAQMRLPT